MTTARDRVLSFIAEHALSWSSMPSAPEMARLLGMPPYPVRMALEALQDTGQLVLRQSGRSRVVAFVDHA